MYTWPPHPYELSSGITGMSQLPAVPSAQLYLPGYHSHKQHTPIGVLAIAAAAGYRILGSE